jgi:hypothetical protein
VELKKQTLGQTMARIKKFARAIRVFLDAGLKTAIVLPHGALCADGASNARCGSRRSGAKISDRKSGIKIGNSANRR